MVTGMNDLLWAVDPGGDTGRALFRGGVLIACDLWDLDYQLAGWPKNCGRLVIEDQVVYPHSPVPPQDIVTAAKRAARAAQILGWHGVEWVKPRTWKGTIPKEAHQALHVPAIPPVELALLREFCRTIAPSKRHNVVDAVLLGRWALKLL